jgi:hypothetical protein
LVILHVIAYSKFPIFFKDIGRLFQQILHTLTKQSGKSANLCNAERPFKSPVEFEKKKFSDIYAHFHEVCSIQL